MYWFVYTALKKFQRISRILQVFSKNLYNGLFVRRLRTEKCSRTSMYAALFSSLTPATNLILQIFSVYNWLLLETFFSLCTGLCTLH